MLRPSWPKDQPISEPETPHVITSFQSSRFTIHGKSDGRTVKPAAFCFPVSSWETGSRLPRLSILSGQDCQVKVVTFVSVGWKIRCSVCIGNLKSCAACAEHTPSGPCRILSLACSPANCLTSTSQFSMKSRPTLILPITFVLSNFSFGLFPSVHQKRSVTFEGSLRTPRGHLA